MNEIKIIALEKKPRSKKYKVITNEEDYNFSEEMLIKYHIFKDQVFTKVEFEKILDDSLVDDYFNKVINLLSISLKSESEIIKYIHDKERVSKKYLKDNQINSIIEKIKQLGYLNEERLCDYILDYYYRNNKGPLYIKQKLIEKKVDRLLIEDTLKKYSYDMEEEAIDKILEKENNKNYTVKKYKMNLTNKLLRNGFSSNIVYKKIDKLKVEDKSNELIEKEFNKIYDKVNKKDITDHEKKQMIINKLLSKGYEYQLIKQYIKNVF